MSQSAVRPATEEARSTYLLGLMIILASTAAFSLGGLFMRLISVDAFTAVLWRGIFCGATVLLWLLARQGAVGLLRANRIGWAGIGVILSSSLAMICYLSALRHTTVANNSVIFGTMPFVVAILAWMMMGERAGRSTLLFAGLALVWVVIVVSGSLGGVDIIGDALSVCMTLLNGLMVVLLRQHRAVSLHLAVGLSALAASALVLPFASPLGVSAHDLGILALFGATQGFALILMTIGGRMIPATDAALANTLSVPLAPAYVLVALGDVPSAAAMAGGGIVLTALLAHATLESIWRKS